MLCMYDIRCNRTILVCAISATQHIQGESIALEIRDIESRGRDLAEVTISLCPFTRGAGRFKSLASLTPVADRLQGV